MCQCPCTDGRLLQAHKRLQELSDLRRIDYLHSSNHFPEIGPDLAGLSALKTKVDEVGLLPCSLDLEGLIWGCFLTSINLCFASYA